jgi:putative hydrolase of the HAD superfamily
MKTIPEGVRAVFFDAVGTLIHPEPAAADAYHLIGGRHGSRLSLNEVRARFAAAFREEEVFDAGQGHRTDEQREVQRWQRIVRRVLDDVAPTGGCFGELYDHFARSDAWRLEADAARLVGALRGAGYRVGLASNFDHRLRDVVAGLTDLPPLDHLGISSEIGWKKPARPFFAALSELTGLSPGEILLVGDDLDNDFHGARAAGLHALMLDPRDRCGVAPRIRSLGELLDGGREKPQ